MCTSGTRLLYPLQVRTIYSDLLEQLEDLALDRPLALLGSCQLVVKKAYSGRKYLYVQGRLSTGAVRQVYLGPFDSRAEKLLDRFGVERSFAAGIGTLTKLLRAAGVPSLGQEWRIVAAMTEGGIFQRGGVLVGELAYRCYSGCLGVRLPMCHTSAPSISADAPPIEVVSGDDPCGSALELMEQGHSPLLQVDPGRDHIRLYSPATSQLLSYLVQDPLSAIALGRRAVLIRVPRPARYAVHALMTFGERLPLDGRRALLQVAEIRGGLGLVDPESFDEAIEDARLRGPDWGNQIEAGYDALERLLPDSS